MKMDFAFNAMSSMCKKKKELPLCKIVIICFQMIEDDWPSAEEDQDKGDVVYGSCVSGFILGLTSLAMMKLRWSDKPYTGFRGENQNNHHITRNTEEGYIP